MRLLTHTVTPQEAGLPVRTLLRRQLRISGSFLAKLKWRPGAITLNGVPVIVSARTEAGDVLAADGFIGNVVLKNTEGTISALFKLLKQGLMSSTKGKLAALLAKDTFKSLKNSFDATEIGGVPLLGVEGAVIKAHGNSNARAIFCAIRQARRVVESGVVETIREGVAQLGEAAQSQE